MTIYMDIPMADMKKLSDNELLSVVRQNKNDKSGRDAVSVLISRYLKLVLKRAHFFSDDYSDVEDLTQEGLLALYKAIESFDPSRNSAFAAFADVCVTNRIKTVAQKSAKINSGRFTDPDETEILADIDSSPENIWLEKEHSSSIDGKIRSVLSKTEASVLNLYLDGLSYKEIALRLGVTEKSVDNALFRIRKKLKGILIR